MARLKLTKTRVKYAEMSGDKHLMLMNKISNGLDWLKSLKNQIRRASSDQDLQKYSAIW
jgi:hypothetical protein